MSTLNRNKHIIVPLVVIFTLFSIVITLFTYRDYTVRPWTMNSDHIQFGNIIHKNIEPDLFPTDFVFNTTRYTDFYTPTFINLLTTLTRITDDYVLSLALTQLPLIIAYFLAMYFMLWYFTRSHAISIIFTLVSLMGASGFISQWELVGLHWMLPRTYALPVLIMAYTVFLFLYHRVDEPRRPYRYWVLLGAMIGLTANFHPTTGMTLAMAMGTIILMQAIKYGHPNFIRLGLVALFTILFALPTVAHVVGNSEIGSLDTVEEESVSFQEFAEIFEWRIRAYPFERDYGRGWTAESEELQFLIRFPWLPLTLLTWFIGHANQRSWSKLLFYAIQLVYIYLTVDNISELLLLALLVYTAYKWWHKQDKALLLLYELCAGILLVTIALPVVFRPIWLHFELYSFTTVVVELARVVKQMHIPLLLMFAMMAFDLWGRWQDLPADRLWARVLFIPALTVPSSLIVAPIGIMLIHIYDRVSQHIQQTYTRYAMVGVATIAITVWLIQASPIFDKIITVEKHYTALGVFLLAVLIWLAVRARFTAQTPALLISLMVSSLVIGGLHIYSMVEQGFEYNPIDILQVAEWANTETPPDTVFAVYIDDLDHHSLFRLYSKRNVYFSEKDLNIIGYAQPPDIVDAYNRYLELDRWDFTQAVYLDEYFELYGVDYIIADRVHTSQPVRDLDGAMEFGKINAFACPPEYCDKPE